MTPDSELCELLPLEEWAQGDSEATATPVTDSELTALALAADPHAPLSPDAIPLSLHVAQLAGTALPQWYMAPATARGGRGWRLPVVVTIVFAFLLIEALGLCNTFGQLTFA